MELNSNPHLPDSNIPTPGSPDPDSQPNNPNPQVFSHENVITPLDNNVQSEEPATPVQATPIVNNQPPITTTPVSSVYPTVTEHTP